LEGVDLEFGDRVDRDLETGSAAEALKSQVVFAVLGLVIQKPSYGYELWQRFESRFGGFLRMSSSAIYPVLSSLATAGLIEEMVGAEAIGVKQGAKPGPSYRATERGTRAYRKRVAERLRGDPGRTEMLGQLVLAGIDGIVAALELLDRYEEQCLLELQEMSPPSASWQSANAVSGLVERLVVEERRRMIDAQLKWVDYARAELRAFAGQGAAEMEDAPHAGEDHS
jgi:DNA-binding PadR family transcriptional regulator